MSTHVKYLLVGGGAASSAAAHAIREIDPDGSLMLVGQEIVRPYNRPPLSKAYLRQQISRHELFTSNNEWFESRKIALRTGRRALHLDVGRGAVTLDQGEVVSYEQLLLATGMSPQHLDVPGGQLPNLFYLRALEDVPPLQKAIAKARHEGHAHEAGSRAGSRGTAVVIGAGFLGVELAASLTQMGIRVDLLCSQLYPWDKFAGEITGKALAAYLEKHGVPVHSHSRPQRLEGDGRVQRVSLNDGRTIECDFAIATVGAMLNRELLRGTPISAERAILTDVHCRSSVPRVFAAGDCAAVFDPLFGKHRILDHWDAAVTTGTLAGRNMAGLNEAYSGVNHFTSQVFDLALHGWGEARLVDHRLVRAYRNADAPELIEFGIAADGRLAQILALGHASDKDVLRSAVQRRLRLGGAEEMLKDPTVPLKTVLSAA